jgi:SAM-dependent methyltransferase
MKPPPHRSDSVLLEANRRFYDGLWSGARLVDPERFNTWPLVRALLAPTQRRLEVAPGLRPRLPIAGTQFVDISAPALRALRARGADAVLAQVSALPFADAAFDLVCALDIVEHVDDDDGALAELTRVTMPGGTVLLSMPLHPSRWTPFDDFVGHRRRYEPRQLSKKLARYGLSVERSGIYGMQPRSTRLLELGIWYLTHHRERAMWWYNRVFMPLGVRFQSKLELAPGMIVTDTVDEIVMVCRKARSGAAPQA